jgi:hypothetical protein
MDLNNTNEENIYLNAPHHLTDRGGTAMIKDGIADSRQQGNESFGTMQQENTGQKLP